MTLNPNILDQMAEVEKAAEKATPRPWEWDGLNRDRVDPENTFIWVPQGSYLGDTLITLGDTYEGSGEDCDYVALAANHTPDIIAFARRLLEVVRAFTTYESRKDDLASTSYHRSSVGYNFIKTEMDARETEAVGLLAALDRDYPGALGRKEGKDAE